MTRLILRNLRHYWRTNLAVVGGVATAVAVLAGALMVGGSVRASLRDLVVQRLGAADVVVASDRFFREELADAMATAAAVPALATCPIIRLEGVLTRADGSRRSRTVQVYGVDARFWRFHGIARSGPGGRSALVGTPLARELGIRPGDDVLLRIELPDAIPKESLFGRRDEAGRTLRLTCDEVLGDRELGEFSLQPRQGSVLAVYLPLARLQRDMTQASRVNAVLFSASPGPAEPERVLSALNQAFSLADAGIRLRPLASGQGVAIESARILLDDPLARAATTAAADLGLAASGVFSYLATSIRARDRAIPYSVITAADLGRGALSAVRRIGGVETPPHLEPDERIWLNEWASRELGVVPGDPIEVDYDRWRDEGGLSPVTARFRLAGVVAIEGDVDAAMAPEFPGISDARDIRAWDPPFPMDLRRIRPADEDYWHRYRATPKAFVALARGQQLWRTRFGQLSSVRVATARGPSATSAGEGTAAVRPAETASAIPALADAMRSRLDPQAAGFQIVPVRARGLAASRGATDFGEYFVAFSFFLIAASLLLAGLFFRLGIEQRVREIGTLQAVGYPSATIRRIFLIEGAVVSGVGTLAGLAGAVAYGALLIAGLRTLWVGAVGTRQVALHVSVADLGVGTAAGAAASLGAVLWGLRGLRRASARAMLAGEIESNVVRRRRARPLGFTAAGALIAAAALIAGASAGVVPHAGAFFGAGVLLLAGLLSLVAVVMRRAPARAITSPGWLAVARLGTRYVTYRPGRSLLCLALIASAAFVIVSVEAFRKDTVADSAAPGSGTGGFSLVAHATLPIVQDPNSEPGREALGIGAAEHPLLAGLRFMPLRERPGEDASCLNLYAPQEPRILGAPPALVREGRFAFQTSLATTAEERRNPWLLLDRNEADGAIPAIGDANTIEYVLHRAVGDEFSVRGDSGPPVRLRLVAALRDSILQGELLIGEAHFLRAFPERQGFRVLLIEAPPARASALAPLLEERLADWGVRIERSADRLATYHEVENTYLSTFQSLGTLGLALGTFGLSAVVLRNVLERRQELALLRAVGYRASALALIILVEHALLMAGGLAVGSLCALLAIVPAALARGFAVPFTAAGTMLLAVLAAGVLSSLVAVAAVWRLPLLANLRSE